MRARIFAGLERASSMNPGLMVVLITLTVRHTGDIGADRESRRLLATRAAGSSRAPVAIPER